MRQLKKCPTTPDYEAYISEKNTAFPNVSLCMDNKEVKYNLTKPIQLIDLGLPSGTKWAACNLGANNPEEYGDYYMWGDPEPATDRDCSYANYKWCNGSMTSLTKYNNKASYGTVDNKTVLDPEDDAAYVTTGGKCHMPTEAQLRELFSATTMTWTTENGVYGRKFTGANGNSIFIPASGNRDGSRFHNQGTQSYVWSSFLDPSYPGAAWCLSFYSSNCSVNSDYRCYGFSVRPVSD